MGRCCHCEFCSAIESSDRLQIAHRTGRPSLFSYRTRSGGTQGQLRADQRHLARKKIRETAVFDRRRFDGEANGASPRSRFELPTGESCGAAPVLTLRVTMRCGFGAKRCVERNKAGIFHRRAGRATSTPAAAGALRCAAERLPREIERRRGDASERGDRLPIGHGSLPAALKIRR